MTTHIGTHRSFRSAAVAAAAVTLLAVGGLVWARADDGTTVATADDAAVQTPGTPASDGVLRDGTHVGRVLAAYVAPDELVFAPSTGGGQVSVPVSADVAVTRADGSSGTYETFTLAFDDSRRSSEYRGASGSYRLTVVDGSVTEIVEQA